MYIDPHTEFRCVNDEKQARITLIGLLVAAILLSAWIIEIVKSSPGLG